MGLVIEKIMNFKIGVVTHKILCNGYFKKKINPMPSKIIEFKIKTELKLKIITEIILKIKLKKIAMIT